MREFITSQAKLARHVGITPQYLCVIKKKHIASESLIEKLFQITSISPSLWQSPDQRRALNQALVAFVKAERKLAHRLAHKPRKIKAFRPGKAWDLFCIPPSFPHRFRTCVELRCAAFSLCSLWGNEGMPSMKKYWLSPGRVSGSTLIAEQRKLSSVHLQKEQKVL